MAFKNQSKICSLPIYPEMTDEMISYVVENILEFESQKTQENFHLKQFRT